VAVLPDGDISTFAQAYHRGEPVLLPAGHFSSLPAIQKWFSTSGLDEDSQAFLNTAYLSKFGDTIVPLEITDAAGRFVQVEQPLQFFLEYVHI